MAYGGKPATDTTDAVRLAIGDTSSSPVLTDDEIDYYYLLMVTCSWRRAMPPVTWRVGMPIGLAKA